MARTVVSAPKTIQVSPKAPMCPARKTVVVILTIIFVAVACFFGSAWHDYE